MFGRGDRSVSPGLGFASYPRSMGTASAGSPKLVGSVAESLAPSPPTEKTVASLSHTHPPPSPGRIVCTARSTYVVQITYWAAHRGWTRFLAGPAQGTRPRRHMSPILHGPQDKTTPSRCVCAAGEGLGLFSRMSVSLVRSCRKLTGTHRSRCPGGKHGERWATGRPSVVGRGRELYQLTHGVGQSRRGVTGGRGKRKNEWKEWKNGLAG